MIMNLRSDFVDPPRVTLLAFHRPARLLPSLYAIDHSLPTAGQPARSISPNTPSPAPWAILAEIQKYCRDQVKIMLS
jgi:hypothetical protein